MSLICMVTLSLWGCGKQQLPAQTSEASYEQIKMENATELIDPIETESIAQTEIEDTSYDFTLCFAGDISLADDAVTTRMMMESEHGIYDCISPMLMKYMQNADFVLAYVHWGTEYSDVLEDVQLETAREYIEAGADVIIGAHPHVLQGMELYKDKPIIYSLGNYWFNQRTLDTMLLNLHFFGDSESQQLEVSVVPALQKGYKTYYVEEKSEQRKLFDYLESISINVAIDDDGYIKNIAN